ncbi:MAG: PorV/PorQ family protein [bacterium]|nr:MAG: PorV/PorQ family protein [bacterium]
MNTFKYGVFFLFSLLFANSAWAGNPNLGTAGAQFLKIPVGARATGLGGAYTGLCDDALSVFWNPAGIVNVKSHSVHFSNMRWFKMFDVNAASYALNLSKFGALALGVMVFKMDKMEITDEFNPEGTGRYFDAQDIAMSASYARRLTEKFRVGISLKYINQRIWNETAYGIAFDVGTQYQIIFQNLTIAMSMRNFGPEMKMDGPDLNVKYDSDPNFPNRLIPTRLMTESYPLPLTFQFGVSLDLYESEFMMVKAAIDAVHPNDNQERIQVGSEVSFYDRLYLRGGYKYNSDDEQYNLGVGVNAFFGSVLLYADYSNLFFKILPDVHLISIGINF